MGSKLYSVSHPDYETWQVEMAATHFQLQLWCSPTTAAAFKSVIDGFTIVANASARDMANPDVQLMQGRSNQYLQQAARHELGMSPKGWDPEAQRTKYLNELSGLRDGPRN